MRLAEDGIWRDAAETLLVFDRAGRELLRKTGQRDRVQVTLSEQRQMRGTIVTHNHPHGWLFPPSDPRHQGSSFSLADVLLAVSARVAEMRVVTPVWRYSLRPVAGQRWGREFFTSVIEPAYVEADRAVRHDFTEAVRARQMTIPEITTRHYHEVWMRVAAGTGVQYHRESL